MKKFKVLLFLLPQILNAQEYWNGIPYPMNRWGISVMGVHQVEKGKLKHASVEGVSISQLDPSLSALDGAPNANAYFLNPQDLKVEADVQLVKVDYFILPFLNIYGIGGKLKAKAKFNLGRGQLNFDKTGNKLNDYIFSQVADGLSGKMPDNLKITQKSEGEILGGGFLLAGEYKRIFTSLQYTYTKINMDGDVAAKTAEVGAARLGYTVYRDPKFSLTPYIGASYQKTDSSIKGVIPNTSLKYKFDMDLEEITPAIGFFSNINENFTVFSEYSFGNKKTFSIDLGYRF